MLNTLYINIDTFLISFYRLSDIPIVGYFIGIFFLSFFCVIAGQLTLYSAWHLNKKWLKDDSGRMVKMHNLSLRALAAKDKGAYKACNKEANDAFGKYFFSNIALGMSSLWPAAFALGWLDTRFAGIDFSLAFSIPLVGNSVGYACTFIPAYILTYIMFGKIKHRLPLFSKLEKSVKEEMAESEKMMSLDDIFA